MTQKTVAKHPEVTKRFNEWDIPEILTKDTKQNKDNKFNCHQPIWDSKCM